ncbi:hypothetical protein OKA04_11990 [Luteolibacter flavescens]|uniref:HEAT repeat domain-containing protein n=1 Tax=Luteolibacter flavescens TaxID=1859460 RepID=A0ABT3FPG8_9BACT|nr:hypothetical protein [Luteolibacter flavescens]MCW1885452.1 hypothetical protein [Luteolibacter flavescens]
MDQPQPDAEKLAIRCPGCAQRFKVGLELRDKIVECGTCEHRFRVNDEVVVRTKRFYPGERKDQALDSFSRVPKTIASPTQATFQQMQYSPEPVHAHHHHRPPAGATGSPLRLLLGFAAVIVALAVGFILVFGGAPGGMLDGASLSKRLMLAGFSAVVSGALLIAANPWRRGRAIFGALATAAILLALPFLFTGGETTSATIVSTGDDTGTGGDAGQPQPGPAAEPTSGELALADFKKKIVYDPMERALETDSAAIGLWLRGLREFHRLQVRDYIVRNTGADPSSHMYPREGDYLMVVTGTKGDLDTLARLCARFGEVTRPADAIRVIEVIVDNTSFQEGPLDKLTDPLNPSFYELNKRELESIDLDRARRAVSRLAPVEPKFYRKDIARRLGELAQEGDAALLTEIGNALPTWSEPGDGMENVIRGVVEKIPAGSPVPESLVKFLATRQDTQAIPLIDALWLLEPNKWEESYGSFGPQIEDKLLDRLPTTTVTQRMSAVRILGKVGGTRSIPVLEASLREAEPEMKLLLTRSLEAIRSRR